MTMTNHTQAISYKNGLWTRYNGCDRSIKALGGIMIKWEYMHEAIDTTDQVISFWVYSAESPLPETSGFTLRWLNNLGNDGWELAGMITERDPTNREGTDDIVPKQYTHLFFKRPVEE